VVVNDHCFGRIVLDNTSAAAGTTCSTGAVTDPATTRPSRTTCGAAAPRPIRRPAFAQLDDARLAAAVALAERIAAEGDPLLRELDARSLAWRGKPLKRIAVG
jgi:hypothetical protein